VERDFAALRRAWWLVTHTRAIEPKRRTMVLSAYLEPLTDPNETLEQGLSERPTIALTTSDVAVLGRSSLTGISDTTIGEEIVQISFDEESIRQQCVKLTLLRDSDKSRVHVNGRALDQDGLSELHLFSGNILSLDNLRYEYRIRTSSHEVPPEQRLKTESSSKKRSNPLGELEDMFTAASPEILELSDTTEETKTKNTPHAALSADTASRLSDEIQCSVCLEIQVHPRTLNPCGHSFCWTCVERLPQCPQCRKVVMGHVPARQLANLISTLVSVPKLLATDDVAHYLDRQKKTPLVVRSRVKVAFLDKFLLCLRRLTTSLLNFFVHCVLQHSAKTHIHSAKRSRRDRPSRVHHGSSASSYFPPPPNFDLPEFDPFLHPFPFPAQWPAPTVPTNSTSPSQPGNYASYPSRHSSNHNNSSTSRRGGFGPHIPPPQPPPLLPPPHQASNVSGSGHDGTGGASAADAICID
jgi:hypothetical protein